MGNKTYALVDPNGAVVNTIIWDGVAPYQPVAGCVAVLVPDGPGVSMGWTYTDGAFIAPPTIAITPATPEQILSANRAKRNQMLNAAAMAMGPLQSAVALGDLLDEEAAMLTAWQQFSVAVNRVDLTQTSPTWPGAPQAGFGAATAP